MKINDNFLLKNIAGKNVVVPVGDAGKSLNGMITLKNESSVYLWNCFKADISVEDVIDKIVHRNMQNYCVQFEDGSFKAIGAFNGMEKEMFKPSGKNYISRALIEYYLDGKEDIMEIVKNLASENNPVLFQELIKKTAKSTPVYVYENGELVELTAPVNRIIAVNDAPSKPLFKKNSSGKLVAYNPKVKFE